MTFFVENESEQLVIYINEPTYCDEFILPESIEEESVPVLLYSFSDEEIYLLQRMVETEMYGAGVDGKTHVASVAINRLYCSDGRFGNSLKEVLTAQNQFCYFRKDISSSTKEAVEYVLYNGDTSDGALFFHSNKKTNTFCGEDYIFTDDYGMHYYGN